MNKTEILKKKNEKNVFKARNSCYVGESFSLLTCIFVIFKTNLYLDNLYLYIKNLKTLLLKPDFRYTKIFSFEWQVENFKLIFCSQKTGVNCGYKRFFMYIYIYYNVPV